MCSVLDADGDQFMEPSERQTPDTAPIVCLKCGEPMVTITLRGKDAYCTPCFLAAMDHKFRAGLGKRRLIRHHDNVLVVHGGGPATSAMLHILQRPPANKQFVFRPHVLFVEHGGVVGADSATRTATMDQVRQHLMGAVTCPVYVTTMNCAADRDVEPYAVFDAAGVEYVHGCGDVALQEVLGACEGLTARQDLVRVLERNLVLRVAKALRCRFVFTAEVAHQVARDTLVGFALGRGSHIGLEAGYCDTRDSDVRIVRPMRDFSAHEVAEYCAVNALPVVTWRTCGDADADDGDVYASIRNLTDKFIGDLQVNYPATIYTVMRTTDKLVEAVRQQDGGCGLCGAPMDGAARENVSALKAVAFSKVVSSQSGRMVAAGRFDAPSTTSEGNARPECTDLCRGCCLIVKDMNNSHLLNNVFR